MQNSIIYLVRHGETLWNTERRYQGQLDSPLTAKGIEQARSSGRLLARLGVRPTVFYHSPLGRAAATTELICHELDFDQSFLTQSDLLKECHFGKWQGNTISEINQQFPAECEKRQRDKWGYRPPGGESYADLNKRASAWLELLPKDSTIVSVAHEMINRVIRGVILGLDQEKLLDFSQSNDTVIRISGDGTEQALLNSDDDNRMPLA